MANRQPDAARSTGHRPLLLAAVAGIALYVALVVVAVGLNLAVILLELESVITGWGLVGTGGQLNDVYVAVTTATQTFSLMMFLLAAGVGAYAHLTATDADPPWAAGAIAAGLGCAVAFGLLLTVLTVIDPSPAEGLTVPEPSYPDDLIAIALYAAVNAILAAIVAAVLGRLR